MATSSINPAYLVYIVASGTKYNVTSALISIDTMEQKKQISQSANIELMNIKANGKLLSEIINVSDRVYIYANDGETKEEVYRGYVWTIGRKTALSNRTVTLKCYDNLIFLQESEDSQYFDPGKTTEQVFATFCEKWGVQCEYKYASITHEKLALRGSLTDIFTSDILEIVKDRTGKDYVILSIKDVMHVKHIGKNSIVYSITAARNAVKATKECTMDDMVTKVVILGKADGDDREPIEATVDGDTDKYGTLQKLLDRDENTSLEDAKEEAQNIIDEKGKPKTEYEIKCPDIPWIRKGDKVFVNAGDISHKFLIAISVERSISNKSREMTLTCIDA